MRKIAGLVLAACAITGASARELTLADRVEAQRAIDRVYYAHQIGATKPFEQAVPQEVSERRVRTYLKQSAALDRFWRTPVSAAMLDAELARIVRGTRMTERLHELFAALGDDPFLIRECLARSALVDRLTRSFHASDPIDKTTWDEWWSTVSPELNEASIAAVAATEALAQDRAILSPCAGEGDNTWDNGSFDDLPHTRQSYSTIWTGSVMILWGGYDGSAFNTGGRYDPATDNWTPTSTVGAPSPRAHHSAVWTGSRMIVWGGSTTESQAASVRTGGSYDPATDTWTATSTAGAPVGRNDHTAVWTGSVMVVWGGRTTYWVGTNTGGRYDPATDTWASTSAANAPTARWEHAAIWTGDRMLVWGGYGYDQGSFGTGARYDPIGNVWTQITMTGAPSARRGHSAVWTGSRMVVWGGQTADFGDAYTDSGGRYDPTTDTWAPTSTVGAPSPRARHTAVWTGSLMIVWGGNHVHSEFPTVYSYYDDGGRYDPATDTWTPTSTHGAVPSPRQLHTAIWTGSLMVIWGGETVSYLPFDTGGRYDPATDSWTPTATVYSPRGRFGHTAVWTGNVMVVWGGRDFDTGGRYDPVIDTWSPTSTVGAPSGRDDHTATWTGSVMVVWGGAAGTLSLNTGGRYDPWTDAWAPTSVSNAPTARNRHTAVWTGNLLVVWGGISGSTSVNTGRRYNPVTDTWTAMSAGNAPPARHEHVALWTGSLMVVWGGATGSSGNGVRSGGRYDPVSDTWMPTPVSLVSAPFGTRRCTAVWTGSKMVVWGGSSDSFTVHGTGGRYDPVTNTWAPTSTARAPAARERHTAVWTGRLMVVWGGSTSPASSAGGRYDPVTDRWTETATEGAPSPRTEHTAIWTGNLMVVWGGTSSSGGPFTIGSGSRYVVIDWPDADDDGIGDPCDSCPQDPLNDQDGDGTCAQADNCPTVSNPGQPDGDGDGKGDACDNCPAAANAGQADTDGDATGDACDGCPLHYGQTSPGVCGCGVTSLDSDGDQVANCIDNCVFVSNPAQSNADGDAAGDACDPCPLDPLDDADGDGLCANVDNCPAIANAGQANRDGDALGDVCDPDVEGDGVDDAIDNCPDDVNPGQQNADGDGRGDACDPCPLDALDDADHDGLCADLDNCPAVANAQQTDWDADEIGNVCDSDPEGDGVASSDVCPFDPDPGQQDRDRDGLGDVCDQLLTVDDDGAAQFETIQAAIDAATAGDIVVVAPGSYLENLVMKPGVDVIGPGPALATVDGSAAPAFPVVEIAGLDDGARLSGFTITGGQGGIRLVGSSAEVDGNVITENHAVYGGGVYLEGDSGSAATYTVVITNNLIVGNDATANGGGISVYYAGPSWRIRHNTIVGNTSQQDAAGIGVNSSSGLEISNNIVSQNASDPPSPGDGIASADLPSLVLHHNDVYGNAGGNYSPPQYDVTGQMGNVSVPPGFANPGAGDYSLAAGSALLDAGSPAGSPPFDIARHPRPLEGNGSAPAASDIGAFERVADDVDQDGIANGLDRCPYAADPAQTDSDGDGVGDACDHCPAAADPMQRDLDRDGVGDACDNCPVLANPDQADSGGNAAGDACALPDADLDGMPDFRDCAPADPTAYFAPLEVAGVALIGKPSTQVSWSPQDAGQGTAYDVITGPLAQLRSSQGFSGATCLATRQASSSLLDARPGPPSGDGFYYLIRAANACGVGTYGNGSGAPDPRDGLDQPGTAPCP